ncbi:MAG: 3-isopropylmalate dehydrogenase [Clostridia bacterium]|nr:3-isopropylmalate dehydrogenase [Clostridia bacterium]
MEKTIAIIPGDGIGPEIMAQTLQVLDIVGRRFGHTFRYEEAPMGGNAYERCGEPLPQSSVDTCLGSDSVLLAAIGGPQWDHLPAEKRPEAGLLGLRRALGVFANIRPARLYPELAEACPLKPEIADQGIDFVVVRELIGGAYFGEHKSGLVNGVETASDLMAYSEHEVERIARVAFDLARQRQSRVCSVDKANVLASSRLWRKVVSRVAEDYTDVTLNHMYVDNCAMQIIRAPGQFDVILTENLFGDILSDEASMIVGSIGLIPSLSRGASTLALYEPIHGSAPDIAGQDTANPLAMIRAAAMMLQYSLDMAEEGRAIEQAVSDALRLGLRTADIAGGGPAIGCRAMGEKIRTLLAV